MDFEFSKIAEKDLENIITYFIEKLFNKKAAYDFYQKVNKIIENIILFPKMYEIVKNDYCEYKNIRRVPLDNFNLYYSLECDTQKITIVRIIFAHYQSELKQNLLKIGSYED